MMMVLDGEPYLEETDGLGHVFGDLALVLVTSYTPFSAYHPP